MEYQRHPDWQLWLLAFGFAVLSIVLGFVLWALLRLLLILLVALGFEWINESEPLTKAEESDVATIYLQPVTEPASKPQEKPFVRTSPDQPESTEKTNERIGEHSTRATSERAADPTAEALPSQHGVEPRDGEIETTESQYQDGELIPAPPLSPLSSQGELSPPSPQSTADGELQKRPLEIDNPVEKPPLDESKPTVSEERSLPPPRETLLEGPETVEVEVPREEGESERPRETPQRPLEQNATDTQPNSQELATNPPATTADQPKEKAFKGNQRKTAMVGSISRTGRSALNVDDTELGRYQAAVSKAVELEWQRNCVRYRDFITPGFITVRFFVEPSGRIRSQNLVGENETGEVQKGFTLNAIREAEIPKMPKSLADAYEGDTLELVFRFYF